MTVSSNNETAGLPYAPASEELDRLHQEVLHLLGDSWNRVFGLGDEEATALVRNALFAYVSLTVTISQKAKWVAAQVCIQARKLRHARAMAGVAADLAHTAADGVAAVSVLKGLETLPADAQKALWLRFHEKRSFREIAEELGVNMRYAKYLVARSLERLEELQHG